MNVDKGLITHWTMDDRDVDSGQLRDRSPYDYHGSISSGVTTGEEGIVNESFNFTSSSGVDIGDPDHSLTGDLTITFWCRADNPSAMRETIIDKAYGGEFTMNVESDTSPSQFRVYHGDNGGNSSNYESSRFGGVFPAGEWVHVAWTRDIDAMEERAYVDGSPHSSNPESMSISPTEGSNPITIGSGYTNPLDGNMEDVRIYDRVLSQKEINHIYQTNRPHETRGTLRKGLIGHWSLDDSDYANGVVQDRTAYDHNGETRGGVTTGIEAPIGEGFSFDGTDDYVPLRMYFDSSDSLPEMTVTTWARSSATDPQWSFLDFDRSEWFQFGFDSGGGGDIQFATNATNGTDDLYTSTTWNDEEWHFIVARYDGVDKQIYVDLNLEATSSNPHSGDPITDATTRYGFLGEGSEAGSFDGSRNGQYYNGDLSDVRLYNRALSETEMERLYNRRTS